MNIGVAIGTYDDRNVWEVLAARAIESVGNQQGVDVQWEWVHHDTLAMARNAAAALLISKHGCDFLVFLDADDELGPSFIEQMQRGIEKEQTISNTAGRGKDPQYSIFQPAVVEVLNGDDMSSPWIGSEPRGGLLSQNYLHIGCVHSAHLFERIGGFSEWSVLEDWAYWLHATTRLGASVVQVPSAVYRVHVDDGRTGRNSGKIEVHNRVASQIRQMYRGVR